MYRNERLEKIQQNAESWSEKAKFLTSDKDHFKMSQTKFEMLTSTNLEENLGF